MPCGSPGNIFRPPVSGYPGKIPERHPGGPPARRDCSSRSSPSSLLPTHKLELAQASEVIEKVTLLSLSSPGTGLLTRLEHEHVLLIFVVPRADLAHPRADLAYARSRSGVHERYHLAPYSCLSLGGKPMPKDKE